MNAAAQNAILKTIEEPPEYAVIFLLTTNRGAFLDTILSRCILLATRPVPGTAVKKYLVEKCSVSKEEAEQRAIESLKLVGLPEEFHGQNPFDLSGGQMRRVAIAGILAMQPDILVLDEPTAGLDPQGRKELMSLFKELHLSGMTIVLVTHLMDDVADYATAVNVMEKGQLVLSGAPKDVFQKVTFLKE